VGTLVSNKDVPGISLFPLATGAIAVALCAFVAAIYLVLETDHADFKQSYRRRALRSGIMLLGLAWVGFFLLSGGGTMTPALAGFAAGYLKTLLATSLLGGGTLLFVLKGRDQWARIFVILLVGVFVFGWGAAQYPFILMPALTIQTAVAPASALKPIIAVVLSGVAVIVVPSFAILYTVFKKDTFLR